MSDYADDEARWGDDVPTRVVPIRRGDAPRATPEREAEARRARVAEEIAKARAHLAECHRQMQARYGPRGGRGADA